MARSLLRALRPVILVGYGGAGTQWLRRVATATHGVPLMSDLVERGVIQFWAVGNEDRSGGAHWWNPRPGEHPDAVRAMLDRARRDELRSQLPGLELQQVLVLERMSLYDPDCEHRAWLGEALEAARLLGEAGDAPLTAFEIDWLTLADGTWPAGKPAGEQRELAARIIASTSPRRVLYIDRQSAARGVVTPEAAEHVLARLAVTILSGDLAFPRREAGNEGASGTLRSPAPPRAITPVSILTLIHRRAHFVELHAETLLRQILSGVADDVPNALREAYRDSVALPAALDADIADAMAGGARFGARERRRRSIAATIVRSLVELAPLDGQLAVKQLRDRIAHYRLRSSAGTDADARQSDTTSVSDTASGGLMTVLRRVSSWAIALLRRLRGAAPGTESDSRAASESFTSGASLDRVLRDWERTADGLEQVFNELRIEIADWNGARPRSEAQAWIHDDAVYHWRLGDIATDTEPRTLTSADIYQRLASALADQLGVIPRVPDASTLRQALRAVAEQDAPGHASLAERQLNAALREPDNELLRHAVRDAPLLVSASGGVPTHEIAWLTASPEAHGDLLRKLEQPQLQTTARVLAMEDSERTVRVAFGADLPWHAVTSLRYLENAAPTTS